MTTSVFRRPGHRRLSVLLLSATALCSPAMAQTGAEPMVLDEIVVTAGGFEQTIRDAPASVSVITAEELEKGSFTSLTDALREVQGVATTGIANEQDIFIRGLPGQYTLILVDGKRQSTRDSRTNGNSGYEQSFIPPAAAIDRIEVVRGPMSSLYGSDAMGGVINIITKPVADTWTGSVTAETTIQGEDGFENSRQLSFYASGPVIADRLGLQIWGRKFDQDASSIDSGPDGSDDHDLSGRLTWQIDDESELLVEAGRTRLTADAYGDLSYRDYDRDHWSVTHRGSYGALDTELSILHETGERTTFDRLDLASGFTENLRSPQVKNTVIDGKASQALDWNGRHQLTYGFQFIRNKVSDQNPGAQAHLAPDDRFDETFSLDQWAVYAEDEWRFRDDLAVTLGLRYNDHEIYGSHVTPRIYAVWDATADLTVKGGISTGFKAPDIRTITPGYALTTGGAGCSNNTPPSCGVILGNPDLEPEETINFEVGTVYESGPFAFSATAFHTKFENKLQQIRTDEKWTDGPQYLAGDGNRYDYDIFRNFNIDEADISGLELAGDWDITPTLSARATYTYTKSEQKGGAFKGLPLARTPEHMASLRFDWATPVTGLDTWLSANYHGSEVNAGLRTGTNGTPVAWERADSNGNGILDPIAYEYDAYTTVDLGANYQINDSATLNIAVYNVLNKEIRATEFNTVMEGRRLWLGVTGNF